MAQPSRLSVLKFTASPTWLTAKRILLAPGVLTQEGAGVALLVLILPQQLERAVLQNRLASWDQVPHARVQPAPCRGGPSS